MLKSNKRPDIIHCHDWQTGLIPVLLYEIYARLGMDRQRVVYTYPQLQASGGYRRSGAVGSEQGRPEYYFHYDRLLDNVYHTAINLMKGGVVYSNYVNTVSPHHSWEARFTDQGYRLGQTLAIHHHKFGGILNGVDYDVWNPEIDRFIPSHYTVWNVEAKYGNKDALRERLWLRKDYKPIVAYVGRLDAQKGVHLIQHALFYSLERGAQLCSSARRATGVSTITSGS